MTMEVDPNTTFDVLLSQNAELPEEEQPRFTFRMLRRRDGKKLASLVQRFQKLKGTKSTSVASMEKVENLFDEVEEVLKSLLVNWENCVDHNGESVPFDLDRFDEVVDEGDLGELMARVRVESGMKANERKKSVSPSNSNSAAVAVDATSKTEESV